MVNIGDELLELGAQQVANQRHQRLEAAKVQAGDGGMAGLQAGKTQALADGNGERIHGKADCQNKQLDQTHKRKTPSQIICPTISRGICILQKHSNINYNIYLMPLTGPRRKNRKIFKNILKKGLRFAKHRDIIHFAADTRELMRRCRTTASTSAFQAEDVGSTPITCSTKQARGKSSGLLAATTAYADVAELADALDSGSSGSDTVGVQVPSSAPKIPNVKAFGIFPFH